MGSGPSDAMDEFTEVLNDDRITKHALRIVDYVRLMFRGEPLHLLHRQCLELSRMNVAEDDQDTPFHAQFYRRFPEIEKEYHSLVSFCIELSRGSVFGSAFQRVPTFRVHVPGGVATKEFHRDTDYHHPEEEVNFVVPLTSFLPHDEHRNGNGLWIEYAPSLYMNPPLVPGQVLRFKGSTMRHGSLRNDTAYTRVSFDFRVIHQTKLPPPERILRSVRMHKEFRVGDYYSTFKGG